MSVMKLDKKYPVPYPLSEGAKRGQAPMTSNASDRQEPARPTGRPSAEAAQHLEEAMMAAAQKVFIEAGFHGASMEAIARAAGVTKRTLYRKARNKADLFVAVVERLAQRSGVPQLSRIAGATLEERLILASDIVLAWLLAPEALALYRMIVGEAERHPGLALMVDAPFQRVTQAIGAMLAEGDERPAAVIRQGADMFLRLIAGEALDRAAQGIEPAGVTQAKRERAHRAVAFFLAGWRHWP
jgi:AcrR family transcriptional regulator